LFLDPEVVGYDIVRELLGYLRPQQLLTGDVLCEQDDLLEDIYFVVTGIVEGVTESLRLPGRNSM
jgi:CRP-like cAMP-binding protein